MDRKTLYFDVETTGTDPDRHALIQLACLVDINGEVVDEQSWRIKPFEGDKYNQEALDVTGVTLDELKSYPEPKRIYGEVVSFFGKHIDKYERNDKFYPAGYNCKFDLEFLATFFVKCGDQYFGSWQNWRAIDPLPWLYRLDWLGKISLPDYKLVTVCNHFGIELGDQAHDAKADVRATRELIKLLVEN